MSESSPSGGWRVVYEAMGVDPDGHEDSPLDVEQAIVNAARRRPDVAREIAKSDAPDAKLWARAIEKIDA